MQIKSGPEATISESIYDHSWNHLSDELSRLDLLISLQLRRQRNVQTPNTEEQLRGLMLSEDEILNLLKEKGPLNSSDRSQPSDSEERQLIETIYQFESHLK
jgi:cyanate lyase